MALMSAPAKRVPLAAWTGTEGRPLCRLAGPVVDAHGVVLRPGPTSMADGVSETRRAARSALLGTERAARRVNRMMGA